MVRTIVGILGAFVGFVLALAGIAALVWLLWWLWNRDREEVKELQDIEIPLEPLPAVEERVVEASVVATGPDDLKRIEGIGPKISAVLQAAGINTFAQLAGTEVGQVERILEAEDPRLLRLADPTTWPEQAALAAGGAWEALEALQNELKGGRRQ